MINIDVIFLSSQEGQSNAGKNNFDVAAAANRFPNKAGKRS